MFGKVKGLGHFAQCGQFKMFITCCLYLFADFSPSLLQTVDGAAIERRCDLQHSIVVIQTATDVRHSDPLLYRTGSRANISMAHNLGCHQVAHLQRKWKFLKANSGP